ncbi:acetyl-CoA carboxylase biotin carboxyl carrier protein subunit [Streptomyces sp. Inha503]|uniref:acetyl-CoA carboxylase biotin carboxyl carrier protein subunit n=1 Tax=Streptomyces sp. Inha503 TaxID=3383314 RepID=UPI00399F64E1
MSVEIKSEVVGTVYRVLVEAGEQVDDAQPLILLESMKMEIPVVSPSAGTVGEINIVEGDSVEADHVLLTLS